MYCGEDLMYQHKFLLVNYLIITNVIEEGITLCPGQTGKNARYEAMRARIKKFKHDNLRSLQVTPAIILLLSRRLVAAVVGETADNIEDD